MAHIHIISEAEATGELADVYAKLKAPDGRVANILKIQSLSPKTLSLHYAFYRELMFGRSALSRAQRELIAVAVSQANNCHYWVEHHAASFRRANVELALADAVKLDALTAPLDAADRALAAYAVELTLGSAADPKPRLAALRAVGFDDAAILRCTEIVGYFNFVNRLADGLGVELEWSLVELRQQLARLLRPAGEQR